MSSGQAPETPSKPGRGSLPVDLVDSLDHISGMAGQVSRLSVTTNSTPAKQHTRATVADPEDTKRDARRAEFVRQLQGRDVQLSFVDLLEDLGLDSDFNGFSDKYHDVFVAATRHAVVYVGKSLAKPVVDGGVLGGLKRPGRPSNEGQLRCFEEYEPFNHKNTKREAALVEHFANLVSMLSRASCSTSPDGTMAWPGLEYVPEDHQSTPVPGCAHQVDCVLYRRDSDRTILTAHVLIEAKSEARHGALRALDLGQVADYAQAVWRHQLTRVFVPVLVLHGHKMTLLVFGRRSWYQCEVGQLCFKTATPYDAEADDVHRCIMRLAFLLSLSEEQFGHFCNVGAGEPDRLVFERKPPAEGDGTSLREASARVGTRADADAVVISEEGHIKRPVSILGRLAHLYRVQYKREPAVLKIVCTPTNRLPESAAYDVLHSAGVERVPEVYVSGVLARDVLGCRFEVLIVRDCGKPLRDCVARDDSLGFDEKCGLIASVGRQVVECLARARGAGVLHRDVSAGNIAVRDGQATLIDWGYAKLAGEVDGADALASRWGFDRAEVMANEEAHDPITGTPLFMSIPILAGAKERGLADDVESALYVLLDALYSIQPHATSTSKTPPGLDFGSNRAFSHVRASCLAEPDHYLGTFGIRECSPDLRALLDGLRSYLFVSDGRYTGCALAADPKTPRAASDDALDRVLQGQSPDAAADAPQRKRARA
ncbi:hypothetical protein H4R18_003769 [Coemansia javaensis]|uniref:Protein kinase domain-containing protein n=1 Tax=Coemansia javaensis TaxID=2761396 RepID=A0A9W8H7Q1_9FUNG|nr:hypothetical protein H4R18_003769 [Coemansia javaensis]